MPLDSIPKGSQKISTCARKMTSFRKNDAHLSNLFEIVSFRFCTSSGRCEACVSRLARCRNHHLGFVWAMTINSSLAPQIVSVIESAQQQIVSPVTFSTRDGRQRCTLWCYFRRIDSWNSCFWFQANYAVFRCCAWLVRQFAHIDVSSTHRFRRGILNKLVQHLL